MCGIGKENMTMEVTRVLLSTLSVDSTERNDAEENLRQFREQNFPDFLLSLSEVLASEEKPVDIRKRAGLVLKNALDAKEQNKETELVQRWLSLDVAVKSQFQAYLLQTLFSIVSGARSTASQVIAKVAVIEMRRKRWSGLIEFLLSNILQVPPHVRQAIIETMGYSCEEAVSKVFDQDQENEILTTLDQALSKASLTIEFPVASTRALYIALRFARAKQWPELIGFLLSNTCKVPPHVKQAIFETLGYSYEKAVSEVIDQDQVNKILTAVVEGMNAHEGNIGVQLASTRALYNALRFAQANFSNDIDWDYIMIVVKDATLSLEVEIQQAAFECLVSIGSTYYEKLTSYIPGICKMTSRAVREDIELIAFEAIEFWSSICDMEIDLWEEYGGDHTAIPCYHFIKQALSAPPSSSAFASALVPLLLETLDMQENDQDTEETLDMQENDQDQDEGARNLAMAAETCLRLFARILGEDIVPLVCPYVEKTTVIVFHRNGIYRTRQPRIELDPDDLSTNGVYIA